MPTKPIERLLFAQGNLCFFCQRPLAQSDASVEHLVATANGGKNGDDNCVACCKALNALFGRMSLKEKLRVVLNQKGNFKCPNGKAPSEKPAAAEDPMERILADLRKRGDKRPTRLKTLKGSINNLFQKTLSETQLSSFVDALEAGGYVRVVGEKVLYDIAAGV